MLCVELAMSCVLSCVELLLVRVRCRAQFPRWPPPPHSVVHGMQWCTATDCITLHWCTATDLPSASAQEPTLPWCTATEGSVGERVHLLPHRASFLDRRVPAGRVHAAVSAAVSAVGRLRPFPCLSAPRPSPRWGACGCAPSPALTTSGSGLSHQLHDHGPKPGLGPPQ